MDRKQLRMIYKRLGRQIGRDISDVVTILNAYGDNYPAQTEAFETIFAFLGGCQRVLEIIYERGLL